MAKVSIPKDWLVDDMVPDVCIVCGEPAAVRKFPQIAVFSAAPFWVQVAFSELAKNDEFGGVPFCYRHRRYWPRRAWLIVGGFLILALSIAVFFAFYPRTETAQKEVPWFVLFMPLWMLVYLPVALIVHLSSTRPIHHKANDLVVIGASRKFARALEEEKLRPESDWLKAGEHLAPRRSDQKGSEDHIQHLGREPLGPAPFAPEFADIDRFSLANPNSWQTLGWVLFFALGFGGAYAIMRLLPGAPGIVFYPVLAIVLYVLFLMRYWLFGAIWLRMDMRAVVFGPLWRRQRFAFANIKAIQILRLVHRDYRKVPYEVNIVLGPSHRLLFSATRDETKALNVAQAVSDMVGAPIVEQVMTEP